MASKEIKTFSREDVAHVRRASSTCIQHSLTFCLYIAQQGRGSGKLDVTFVSGPVQLISDIKWIIVDSKVYDIGRFKDLHPGGASVLLDEEIGEST